MLSRCGSSIVTTVLLVSGLLLGFVQAEAEDKAIMRLGNETIERVINVFLYLCILVGQLLGEDRGYW